MTQNKSWHLIALENSPCAATVTLQKVHHKCHSCQQKVHGPLCGHADEASFGGPVIICFKCQDSPEHILNAISGNNVDNDIVALKSVETMVAIEKSTDYDNAWPVLEISAIVSYSSSCAMINTNFNIILQWLLV